MKRKQKSKSPKAAGLTIDEARAAAERADKAARASKDEVRSAKSKLKSAKKAFKAAEKEAKKLRKEARRAQRKLKALRPRRESKPVKGASSRRRPAKPYVGKAPASPAPTNEAAEPATE